MIEKINGSTRLCGVIGNPIAHTLSPLIHNTLSGDMGVNLVYVPFHVTEDLAAAVRGAYHLNVLGMNVTVPYKSQVMEALVEVDEGARTIGSVNTLVRTEGGFKGYNTDYLGLRRAMVEDGIQVEGRSVLLLGAGGAARAAAYLAGSMGARELCIMNRTKSRGETLAEEMGALFPEMKTMGLGLDEAHRLESSSYTAIQTTKAGMWPEVSQLPVEDDRVYEKIDQAVDIIFNPENTEFMKKVRAFGGVAVNGLKMLLYQGIIAYELWNDVKVSDEEARRVYECMKKEFESE